MGAQPSTSSLHKRVGKVKTCVSGAEDDYTTRTIYQSEPIRRQPVADPKRQSARATRSTGSQHHSGKSSPSTDVSPRSSPASGLPNKHSNLRRLSASSPTTKEDGQIVSWLSDVHSSMRVQNSVHHQHPPKPTPTPTPTPTPPASSSPPTVREALQYHDVTPHFRHIHQHQGRLAAGPRTSSSSSVTSTGASRPLQASWAKLEVDLEYHGMILLDKILELEPQACYLLTFVRHTDINQLLSDLSQQRILAVRIMETVGLMVECADDWKTAEPVLSSLARRHGVSQTHLQRHVHVINTSLFTMLRTAMGADWTAEMATEWKMLLARVCDTLFNPTDGRCATPNSGGSSNNLAWTSVKWKSADGKEPNRKQSYSPLPFKSLDDLSKARQSPPRSSPLNRLPSLRLTRTTSSSPTKEYASRKSSCSSASAQSASTQPCPKSALQRSWSSR